MVRISEIAPRGGGGGGSGGEFLHMNINLDSINIIITWHKIVASFFLRRFLLPVSILLLMRGLLEGGF